MSKSPNIHIDCDSSKLFRYANEPPQPEPFVKNIFIRVYGIDIQCGFTLRDGVFCSRSDANRVLAREMPNSMHKMEDILLYFYDAIMDMLIYHSKLDISPFPPGSFLFHPNADHANFHMLLWEQRYNSMLYKAICPMQEFFDTIDNVGWMH